MAGVVALRPIGRDPQVPATFVCAAARGRPVDEEQCTSLCGAIPKNRQFCTSCESPWRLCLVCLGQGRKGKDARVIDAKRGLCDLHATLTPVEPAPTPSTSRKDNVQPTVVQPKELTPLIYDASTLGHETRTGDPGVVLQISVDRIRRFEGQPRTEFNPEHIKWLSESIATVGQLVPVLVRAVEGDPLHDYELIDGECRLRACKKAGVSTILAVMYEGVNILDAKKRYTISAIANFGRMAHTPLELACVIDQLRKNNQWTYAQIATALCMAIPTVLNHSKLLRLCPEVQAMMRSTEINRRPLTIGQAVLLVDYPEDFQLAKAKEIIAKGLNATRAGYYVRSEAAQLHVKKQSDARGRYQSDLHQTVMRGLKRIKATLEQYQEMPEMSLGDLFRGRTPAQRLEATTLIREMIASLKQMEKDIQPPA